LFKTFIDEKCSLLAPALRQAIRFYLEIFALLQTVEDFFLVFTWIRSSMLAHELKQCDAK